MSDVLVALAALLLAVAAVPQAAEPDQAQIDKLLRDAEQGSVVVRPQAARRLLKLGKPAADRLVKECGTTPRQMAALGADLVEVLAEFGDDRLREQLWQALADRDFPWRPAATRSLAVRPLPAEVAKFDRLLDDPLGAVRAAALNALGQLDARDHAARVHELLADPDDRVRREAARTSDRFGDATALAWLLEDLTREDRFFEMPTGKMARFEAARMLEQILGARDGFEPAKPPSDPANQTALAAMRERCTKRAQKPLAEVPSRARAGQPVSGEVIGLEVRSCRHGEFFLRWTTKDELLIGLGNPEVVKLADGTVAALIAEAQSAVAELEGKRVYGSPGCDLEQLHWQPDPQTKAQVFAVMKTPDMTAILRPAPLSRLAQKLLATIADPALRGRVSDALVSVGGKLD